MEQKKDFDLIWLHDRRKQLNRELAKEWLAGENIPYQTFNNDLHFKIRLNDQIIDFWPTTNKIKVGDQYQTEGIEFLVHLKMQLNFRQRINND